MSEAETNSEVLYRNITIAGVDFQVKAPYKAGHPLNEAEASQLNQVFAENVRNNVAGKIKAAKEAFLKTDGATEDAFSIDTYMVAGEEEGSSVTLRSSLQDYADNYEFGIRVARNSEPVDPVEREARVIAREMLNTQLKAAGSKKKDVSDEAYEGALKTLAARPAVVKEAKRRVDLRSKLGEDELDLEALLGGGDEGSAEAEGGEEQTEA